jgi:hypothetical protein
VISAATAGRWTMEENHDKPAPLLVISLFFSVQCTSLEIHPQVLKEERKKGHVVTYNFLLARESTPAADAREELTNFDE